MASTVPCKIQIFSDLHLEFPSSAYESYDIQPTAPYLALLGDIGNTKDDGLFAFIRAQLTQFQIVFFLLGNHEPYNSDWDQSKARIQAFTAELSKEQNTGLGDFIFLDQTRYDIDDETTILGCTLYSNVLPEQLDNVSFGLQDFYNIKDWTVADHNEAHKRDLAWLNGQVTQISKNEPNKKNIFIFTHHSPHYGGRATDPRHNNDKRPITSGFATDLKKEICMADQKVTTWVFGHTHYNCDFIEEGSQTRLVTNQRGYYFALADGFDGMKCISSA